MANLPISGLTASASNLAATDVTPVVQTTGVGPVKMTGLQLAGGLLGSTTFNGSTITTSQPVLNLSQTWNASGVTFTGLLFNATDTASASGSLLLDLQVGGSPRVQVRKDGTIFGNNGTSGGYFNPNSGAGAVLGFQTNTIAVGTSAITMSNATSISFGTALLIWNGDTILSRAAAATLQLGAANAAGTTASVTINFATNANNITWTTHGLTTGNAIQFSASVFPNTTSSPAAISATTTYYVIVVDANTIRIARTYDTAVATVPTPVAFTSNGTSVVGRSSTPRQTFRVQSFTGTDIPGQPFVIQGSSGTGNQNGGDIVFQVAPAGSTGSSQNAYSTALTIASDRSATFSGYVNISASNKLVLPGSAFGISFDGTAAGSDCTAAYNSPYLNFYIGVGFRVSISSSALRLDSAQQFGWTSGASNGGTFDTILARDAANTLALRNGTSAQRFNVYNTYTSSTNYETFKIDWITTANTCLIGTEKGVSGTARALAFQTDGTTRLTISAAGAITQAAGTLADGTNAYSLTATMPASPTGTMTGVNFSVTGAGSSSNAQTAVNINLNAGYTGSALTNALAAVNLSAGTSNIYAGASSSSGYRPFGNRGFNLAATGVTSGINTGVVGQTANSTTANYGVWGSATFAVNSSWNVGVAGFGLNTGTGTQQVGGFFALYDGGTNAPNLISAALVADNGTTTSPIFLARDNNSTVFTIADGGAVTTTSSIQTGAPTGGTAAAWKLGSRVAATTTLDTTQYIEVDVGGTLYKLAVVTS